MKSKNQPQEQRRFKEVLDFQKTLLSNIFFILYSLIMYIFLFCGIKFIADMPPEQNLMGLIVILLALLEIVRSAPRLHLVFKEEEVK